MNSKLLRKVKRKKSLEQSLASIIKDKQNSKIASMEDQMFGQNLVESKVIHSKKID